MPEYPESGYNPPLPLPASYALRLRDARRGSVSLSDTREYYDPILANPELREYTPVLAYYVYTGTLAGTPGSRVQLQGDPLRPEPFVLRRITWATTADLPGATQGAAWPWSQGSQHGRVVEVGWGDEFTEFLANKKSLVSSIFGDSAGYLDIPALALFQGGQKLHVNLERLDWPLVLDEGDEPYNSDWDFVFHGFGLLPKGVSQSGSLGASGVPEEFKDYTQVPSQYRVRVELDGNAGAHKVGSEQLRPAVFLCQRITWATSADTAKYGGSIFPNTWGSMHGRAVRVSFGDPFTKFFGRIPGLVPAVFGESQGFLDLPRGILLQGSQPITVTLDRLFWPVPVPEATTIWDFTFHGVDLLPFGVHQSGSAG